MDHLIASDNLPGRPSGPWAKEKLYYVGRYMRILNGGMKDRWPYRAFVDLMAGPGTCIDRDSHSEFPGSPLLAAETIPPFTHVVLVEDDDTLHAALSTRLAQRSGPASVLKGDCNDPALIERIRTIIPPNALTLVFADMLGLEVTFEALRRLTLGRQMDLIITFQTNDVFRNVKDALETDTEGERIDRFFGTQGWRERVTGVSAAPLQAAERLMEYYRERLGTIGYPATTTSNRLSGTRGRRRCTGS